MSLSRQTGEANQRRWWAVAEIGLIFLIFFIFAGGPPPDVNEAHYLVKAQHYWQPACYAGDVFLDSADAHLVFYWTFGWLTRFLSLPATAWIGRAFTWGLLAWSWRRLSHTVVPQPMVSVLSACLMLLFTQRFHMAGEWIVGGVEAKGLAFVLVFLALESMLRGRWQRVWLLLGLATACHVLVGGWSMVAALCAWFSCGRLRPPLRTMTLAMLAGMILALPGLVPAILLSGSAGAEVVDQANRIYVFARLPHHLVFHEFPHAYMVRHALLVAAWVALCLATPCRVSRGVLGQRPLRGFAAGAVLLALAGVTIDQACVAGMVLVPSLRQGLESLAAGLLKYYWFRLSDAMVPVAAALAAVAYLRCLLWRRPRIGQWALAVAVGLAGANLAYTNWSRRSDFRPRADVQMLPAGTTAQATRRTYEDWRRVCWWIRANTGPHSRFLTPHAQQTFKWYAQRSEVCSWKDVPQDAASVVRWWKLQRELYPRRVVRHGLAMHGEARLLELARKYEADYIVVDRHRSPRPLLLPRVYPDVIDASNACYEVYRVPRKGAALLDDRTLWAGGD